MLRLGALFLASAVFVDFWISLHRLYRRWKTVRAGRLATPALLLSFVLPEIK